MKKQRFSSIITVIGCLLILLISACGNDDADDDDYNNDYDDSEHPITGYTHIEWALAKALGKVPGEEITPDELATLTRLTVPPPNFVRVDQLGWQYIGLLAHCVNLKELNLSGNPVAGLSSLAGLTGLERLDLSNTLLSDLEPLAELVNLQRLDLSMNQLEDLTPLVGMIRLKELYLQNSHVHDITPLANLIQIERLYLHDNLIVDLKPLVNNPGLVNKNPVHLEGGFEWRADTVTVRGNPLSDISRNVYIPALEARGVIVRH